MPPRRRPEQSRKPAKAATTSIGKKSPPVPRPINSNRRNQAFSGSGGPQKLAATIYWNFFSNWCNFFTVPSVYSSVCRFPPPSHLPPRRKPRGFFLLEADKIPAAYAAGEGGMVEEIYIHYYRHLER